MFGKTYYNTAFVAILLGVLRRIYDWVFFLSVYEVNFRKVIIC